MKIVYRTVGTIAATGSLGVILIWFANAISFRSWVFAFGANWFIIVWCGTLYVLTRFQFPARYYRPKLMEKSGRLYELLGVLLFRKLVLLWPFHKMAPSLRYSGRRDSLYMLERETRIAEAIHALPFVVSLVLSAYAAWQGWLDATGWLLLFNVLMNVYPIILQRYNRVRLERLIQRRTLKQMLQRTALVSRL